MFVEIRLVITGQKLNESENECISCGLFEAVLTDTGFNLHNCITKTNISQKVQNNPTTTNYIHLGCILKSRIFLTQVLVVIPIAML